MWKIQILILTIPLNGDFSDGRIQTENGIDFAKDAPPTSRTEFDGLTDLMKYLAMWGKE